MKLGEMLVRDGRLSEDQLTQVLAYQGKGGGRLGTVLVELGLIDLDALTVYLGLELGIPIATGAMLDRAKRSAVRLLTPDQAFRHKVVPLIVQVAGPAMKWFSVNTPLWTRVIRLSTMSA